MNRRCCDGLCGQGRDCPAFAPGVIVRCARRQQHRVLRKWSVRCAVLVVLVVGITGVLGAWS